MVIIASISLHFEYEYFNNQATGPRLRPGPVSRHKLKQDRDQSLGPEMTGTGTGPGPVTFSGPQC